MYDFGYLKPISKIIDVLGRVILSLAFLISIIFFATAGADLFNILIGIGILACGGILGLLLILCAQLVQLFLQIEENTRNRIN